LLLEKQTLPFSAGTLKSLGLARREAQIQHLERIYQRLGVESHTGAVSRTGDLRPRLETCLVVDEAPDGKVVLVSRSRR